jgi:two-component system sensor histidine kinase CssS
MGIRVQAGGIGIVKSMKKRILIPFLLVLAITPVITLGIFNILIRGYMNDGITTQLKNTVVTTQVLIKTELSQTIYETDQDKVNQSISNLNRILRTSKIALNTELLLFKATGEMIYPASYENTFLEADLISEVQAHLETLNVEDAVPIISNGNEFIVMGYKLTQLPLSDIPYIVFISSMDIYAPVFRTINMILIAVMFLGIIVGTFFAYHIAGRVASPVKELCDATRKIGERKNFTLEHQTDVSEIAELSDSILMMSRRLEAYDKAQKAFLQNASHELKTPLMSIQGYAEGIESGIFPDEKKAGAIIKEESRKLNQLLTELLILSRIENQNYDQDTEKAMLNEIIKEFLQRGEGIALKEKKRIRYLEDTGNPAIAYNESLFTQCFMNVLCNAIRYASQEVTVRVSGNDKEAVIEVTDDRKGLEEKDIPRLFERFYKGAEGQSGLGLAIAKSAVEAMNGTILAANGEKGAKFTLILPLWRE